MMTKEKEKFVQRDVTASQCFFIPLCALRRSLQPIFKRGVTHVRTRSLHHLQRMVGNASMQCSLSYFQSSKERIRCVFCSDATLQWFHGGGGTVKSCLLINVPILLKSSCKLTAFPSTWYPHRCNSHCTFYISASKSFIHQVIISS